MRWLLIVLLISLVALLFAAAGVAFHIWKQRTRKGSESSAAIPPAEETDREEKR
jgi:flagellar basal body-associated protein FliL